MGLTRIEPTNREHGAFFEEAFERLSRYSGLLPLRNRLTATIDYRGRPKLLPSQLDFRLITRFGDVAYVDCKSFAGDFFTYSDLNPNQIEQAVLLNEWMVPAGFVVFFRATNQVGFFSGQLIDRMGPRARFSIADGVSLGNLGALNPRLIFAKFDGLPF